MRLIQSLAITCLLAPLPSMAQDVVRKMAVTIDDLPTVNVAVDSDQGRRRMTLDLLNGLAERDIPVTGFVNEVQLDDGAGNLINSRVDLLQLWLAAGFDLGNHSYSHPDLHRVPLADFQADVLKGELVTRTLLAEFGKVPRYFRHPYLHTGTSLETKTALESFLTAHDYAVAPVSIDNSEWIFARAYVIAMRTGDEELAERIGRDYVEYMLEMVAFYEDQSQQLFDRNISHILLIHANQLNADWFGALADRLAGIDYGFITLDEALEDVAYDSEDTYTGPGGITWIHRWAITRKVDPSMFHGEPTTPDYVLELTRLPEHSY
ncbi:MAG: polysaccharide deacetylase family protein [Woeseiaceae bacterium]